MFKNVSILFGAIFLLVGVLGFIPPLAPQHADGARYLFGLFMVSGVHNLVYLLTGAAGVAVGRYADKYTELYFQVFGPVYALFCIVGFIQGSSVLGIFHVNRADNFLHLVLALALLTVGFGQKSSFPSSVSVADLDIKQG